MTEAEDENEGAECGATLDEATWSRIEAEIDVRDKLCAERSAARVAEKKDVACNLCSLPCAISPPGSFMYDLQSASGLTHAIVHGGYESTPGTCEGSTGALSDMDGYHFSLCEFCLDWLFQQFRLPVEVFDVMTGEKLPPYEPAKDRAKGLPFEKDFLVRLARHRMALKVALRKGRKA